MLNEEQLREYRIFKKQLPTNKKKQLTEELYEKLLTTVKDDKFDFTEDMITYAKVLENGRWNLEKYVNAVKYVSLKNMGFTNHDAYSIVFKDKVNRWLIEGVSIADQHKYISAYNKGDLIVAITERTLIPAHVMNQDKVQMAINELSNLVMTAKSEMVRMKAAEALIRELKLPENNKVELEVSMKPSKELEDLKNTMRQFASKQLEAINTGVVDAKGVAEMKIIEAEIEE